MSDLSTGKIAALLKMRNDLRLVDNCTDSLALKLFMENRDFILWLSDQFYNQREALEWYRDAQYDPALSDDMHDDKGQRAREALKGER